MARFGLVSGLACTEPCPPWLALAVAELLGQFRNYRWLMGGEVPLAKVPGAEVPLMLTHGGPSALSLYRLPRILGQPSFTALCPRSRTGSQSWAPPLGLHQLLLLANPARPRSHARPTTAASFSTQPCNFVPQRSFASPVFLLPALPFTSRPSQRPLASPILRVVSYRLVIPRRSVWKSRRRLTLLASDAAAHAFLKPQLQLPLCLFYFLTSSFLLPHLLPERAAQSFVDHISRAEA